MGYGFGLIETVFPSLFLLMFVMIFGLIVASVVRGIRDWGRDERSPRLTVDAVVAAKRTNVSHAVHTGADHFSHHSSSTTYYATFQVESGDRMELRVSGPEYGMLAEGDTGRLSFQGGRYLGFERT